MTSEDPLSRLEEDYDSDYSWEVIEAPMLRVPISRVTVNAPMEFVPGGRYLIEMRDGSAAGIVHRAEDRSVLVYFPGLDDVSPEAMSELREILDS